MVGKVNKRTVDALRATDAASVFLWDSELPRFGVKASAESKSYVVQYRVGRRLRRFTIGRHGEPWAPDAARREALRLLALVAAGIDPAEAKQASRTVPTVRELAERFLLEHVEAKRKPTTAVEYRRIVEVHLLPAFGARAITSITRADVARLHHRLSATPMMANRVLATLSKFMNWCEAGGCRPDRSNPVRHVERYRERRRERYLTAEELRRLGDALDAAERGAPIVPNEDPPVRLSPFAVAAIRLLLFTGARRDEILTLRWEDVDLERTCLRLPDSKTGHKIVHLNAPALAVLDALPRVEGNPHVIVGQRNGAHLVNLKDSWHLVRRAAHLADVRLHDLRHGFASVGAGAGVSLRVLGGLLGHTQPGTTQRYAHLQADPLKQAVEMIGDRLAAAMGGGR